MYFGNYCLIITRCTLIILVWAETGNKTIILYGLRAKKIKLDFCLNRIRNHQTMAKHYMDENLYKQNINCVKTSCWIFSLTVYAIHHFALVANLG